MSKINKRSLCKIQIYTKGKHNRLTMRAECGMILVLGGLLAACFFVRTQADRSIKKVPLIGHDSNRLT